MSERPPDGEYVEAWRIEIGWWLWLGTHWEKIIRKRMDRHTMYLTTERAVYRVGTLEAVAIRRTPPR